MSALSPDSVYRNNVVAGVSASGDHEPDKAEIRGLLNMIMGTASGSTIVKLTKTQLDAVTPTAETYGGLVLTGVNAGYYYRSAAAWVFGRGFPDTFARVTLGGTVNAQTGSVATGVNPADIEVFYAVVTTENTGAMTLSVSSEAARDVVNAAGNALSAGEWTGHPIFYLNDDGDYQLINDPGSASASAQSATNAEEWAQSPDPISVAAGGDGATDQSSKTWSAKSNAWAEEAEDVEVETGQYSSLHHSAKASAQRVLAEAARDLAQDWASNAVEVVGLLGHYATVASLLADTDMGYAGSTPTYEVAEGVVVEAQGFRYEVAASGASDHHLTTAGGVKLYVLPGEDGTYNALAFGVVGDGVAVDTTVAVAAITALAGLPLFFPPNDYLLNDIESTTFSQDIRLFGVKGLTRFFVDDGSHGIRIAGAGSNLYVTGITFEGFDRALYGDDAVNFLGNIEIIDCEFIDCARAALIRRVTRFLFERSHVWGTVPGVTSAAASGVCCLEYMNAKVLKSTFHDMTGVAVQFGENDYDDVKTMENGLISGCDVWDIHSSVDSAEVHGYLVYGNYVAILGCTVKYLSNGGTTGCEGIYAKVWGLLVDDCTLVDAGQLEAAITLKGAEIGEGPGAPGYHGHDSYDHIISNNIIIFTIAFAPGGGYAVKAYQKGTKVIGNYVVNGFISAPDNSQVEDNTFRDSFPFIRGDLEGDCTVARNHAFGTAPDPAYTSGVQGVLNFGVAGAVTQLTLADNTVDMDMNGWAPSYLYGVRLLKSSGSAVAVDNVSIRNNEVHLTNLTYPANSGPFSISGTTYLTPVGDFTFDGNDLPLGAGEMGDFGRIKVRAFNNANEVAQAKTRTVPILEPATTAGKVKLSNAIVFTWGLYTLAQAIADNKWDLTAVTTAAGEYKKVLLALSTGGTASIIVGTAATAAHLAKLPLRVGTTVAVGYVALPPSYAGGAISAAYIVPIFGGE